MLVTYCQHNTAKLSPKSVLCNNHHLFSQLIWDGQGPLLGPQVSFLLLGPAATWALFLLSMAEAQEG